MIRIWKRLVNLIFSIGAHTGEDDLQRTKRRIFVVAAIIATLLTIPEALELGSSGRTLAAAGLWVVVVAAPVALAILHLRPSWFPWVVNSMMFVVVGNSWFSEPLVGGLLRSEIAPANVLIIPLAALMILGRRPAIFWFGVYVVTIIYAAAIPNFVDPVYEAEPSRAGAAETLISMGIVVMAITLFFVRQRDRFQQESDDLLHNILPNEIVARLKTDTSMIADDFPHASVLFADVVGFTPMSAGMTPPQLVGLLNDVFTTFDQFASDLGVEKIKTVGDEYMVASGVPVPRTDHAEAIAELALRMRDHVAAHDFDGHHLVLRIGINSGPVVAGIIGTHKFSYDLWGDTVNTASRMESSGIPGQIQVSAATHELLRDNGYGFEPRGTIAIKGKGQMETWLLVGPSSATPPARREL